jgi:hypothetical protein
LVLNTSVDLNDATARLEAQGAHISSRIPPQIIIANVPSSLMFKNIYGAKTIYQSAIPLTDLQPLGLVASAAGMKWNRSFLSKAAGADTAAFASMRSLVSQKSLAAPADVTAVQNRSMVVIAWKAVPSALFYEVQAASDSGFANITWTSNVAGLSMNAPAPEGNGAVDVFYRVRAQDHGDDEHLRDNNILGTWSNITPLRVQSTPSATPLKAPMPTSPLDDYHSEGFTLIPEWSAIGAQRYRIQVATDDNFKRVLFDNVVEGRSFICSSPAMELGDVLYWRVKAWDDQKSAWSDVHHFTIESPSRHKADVFVNPEAPK